MKSPNRAGELTIGHTTLVHRHILQRHAFGPLPDFRRRGPHDGMRASDGAAPILRTGRRHGDVWHTIAAIFARHYALMIHSWRG
ncbi:hypothetical protein Ntsu_79910 [Nocardia sp. IFM 10818]